MSAATVWPAPTGPAVAEPAGYIARSVGDVFVCSWGYDQTNVDAFVVVRVSASGKTVWTMPAKVHAPDDGGPSVRVMPTRLVNPDGSMSLDYTSEDRRGGEWQAKQHRISDGYRGVPVIRVGNGNYTAHLWNGIESFHQTGYNFGY